MTQISSLRLPSPRPLSSLPAAALASARASCVVDLDRRICRECTACRAASTALQGQVQQGQTRAQALEHQLKPKPRRSRPRSTRLAASSPMPRSSGRDPAFQTKQQAAQTELANQAAPDRIDPGQRPAADRQPRSVLITEQVRARRQADIVVGKNATLASNSAGRRHRRSARRAQPAAARRSASPRCPQQSRPQPAGEPGRGAQRRRSARWISGG